MEALVYADHESSVRLSIQIGFTHEFGCKVGLMLSDRGPSYEAFKAYADLKQATSNLFYCNVCGQSVHYGAEWLADCVAEGRVLLQPPPEDFPGVQKARKQIQLIREGRSNERA